MLKQFTQYHHSLKYPQPVLSAPGLYSANGLKGLQNETESFAASEAAPSIWANSSATVGRPPPRLPGIHPSGFGCLFSLLTLLGIVVPPLNVGEYPSLAIRCSVR